MRNPEKFEPGLKKSTEEEKRFEYKIKAEDLDILTENADNLFDSKLLDSATLKDLRIITFDSENFYIITRFQRTRVGLKLAKSNLCSKPNSSSRFPKN